MLVAVAAAAATTMEKTMLATTIKKTMLAIKKSIAIRSTIKAIRI